MARLSVCVGDLRHYITLQRATAGLDAHNGHTESWATLAEAWADIQPISAREFVSGNQITQDVTHKVRLRYYDGLTASDRFTYEGRTFNIHSVINANERNEWTELLAKEVINGG